MLRATSWKAMSFGFNSLMNKDVNSVNQRANNLSREIPIRFCTCRGEFCETAIFIYKIYVKKRKFYFYTIYVFKTALYINTLCKNIILTIFI